jgi:8-oxo-dGTP pyrophosphatase MutT (NUDIX family)
VEADTKGAEPLRIRIDHDPVPDPDQPVDVVQRTAVRAVIRRGTRLLMVHSTVGSDYKFPGGGLEPGESPQQALIREVSEECGRTVTRVGEVMVKAVERRRALEPGAVFRMESTYHECEVADEVHEQRLDAYEHELAFEPVWIGIHAAIEANERVLAAGTAETWVARETAVLRALHELG